MEFSASGTAALPIILISIAIPLLIFLLIPIFVIRSIMKAVKKNLPAGTSLGQLKEIMQHLPKGADWKTFTSQWEIKMEPETKIITLKRKTGTDAVSGNESEIRINSLSELPALISRLSKQSNSSQTAVLSSQSTTTTVKSTFSTPKNYEAIQTIKKVALVLVALGSFYALKDFFA